MGKNVLIPHPLFLRVVELLEHWDIPHSHDLRMEYCDVLSALILKSRRLELRDAYSNIISAKDDDARTLARIAYLRKKGCIGDVDLPEIPF